jgi:hypothetical protein
VDFHNEVKNYLTGRDDTLDLSRTIQELHAERKRIIDLIRAVEQVRGYYASRPAPRESVRRRGRKSMDVAERLQVSERMKKYWAMRRSTEEQQDWAATG